MSPDAFEPFLVDQLGDFFDQARLVDLVRNFRDDDDVAILSLPLDGRARPHRDLAAAGLIGLSNSAAAINDSGRRKIGTWNVGHHVFASVACGLLDEMDDGLANLRQIVRRHVGRHADGNTVRAIHQKIGNFARQIRRLFAVFVVVGNEIDRVFVDVFEKRFGKRRHARFGVSHRGRRIAVDRSEVALSVDQRIAIGKILSHPDERVVNGTVAVRMVVTHHFADDLRALAVGAIRCEAHVAHADKNPAMDGLQTVAHIGQRAADDDAHRVVDIRPPHLVFDIHRNEIRRWRMAAAVVVVYLVCHEVS